MDYKLEIDRSTFLNLIDNIYDEICIWDDKYKLVYINKSCYRHYGIYPDEMIGKTLDFFVDKEDYWNPSSVPYIYKEKKPVIQRQKTFLGIDIETISIPILDENNHVKYVVQSVRDSASNLYKKLSPISGIAINAEDSNEGIIYKSFGMNSVLEFAKKIAPVKAPVLILGETGTGKNVIAKYVHDHSERKDKPFIIVNMASINPTMIESELFGYKKGAFTGASTEGKKGLFEIANGGTFFLDEIGELPYDMQAKLLHVIQEEEIIPIGGVHPVKIDIRIVSATNCDLSKMVEAGKFRQDLYHRLNVFELTIPPLRSRKVDIPLLASHFLNIFNKKYTKCTGFSDEVMEVFLQYPWGGNVRELSNIVERCVLTSDAHKIKITDLPDSFFSIEHAQYTDECDMENMSMEMAMACHEEAIIRKAYDKYGSSRKVAAALQISQTKANRLIHKYVKQVMSKPPEKNEEY